MATLFFELPVCPLVAFVVTLELVPLVGGELATCGVDCVTACVVETAAGVVGDV